MANNTGLSTLQENRSERQALMSIERTREFMGNRGRGWVYERIRQGDFETVTDGGRRLVLTDSVLGYIEKLRGGEDK